MRWIMLGTFAVGCVRTEERALEKAREAWVSEGVPRYAYTVRYSCFCPAAEARVMVRGAIEVEQRGEMDVPNGWIGGVPAMHDAIEDVLASRPDRVVIRYGDAGIPARIDVDGRLGVADDEWTVEIEGFEPL